MKECDLYEKLDEDTLRCLSCAHKCKIKQGNRGICGVRENKDGKLYLLVYERPVSVAIDPIEKKPFYHFFPKSRVFSFGTVGCNFRCENCQNFDISQFSEDSKRDIYGKSMGCKEIVENAIKDDCIGIAYTYNEPVIFSEFVLDVSRFAKEKGLRNIMVTNGFWSKEVFDYLKDSIDAVNIDLKGSDDFYKKYCGARLEPVLETIKRCNDKGMHIEITTLLIPGLNDSEKDLEEIASFIASVNHNIPWHISRFFPMYKMKDRDITPEESMGLAYSIGKKYLENVYLGNV